MSRSEYWVHGVAGVVERPEDLLRTYAGQEDRRAQIPRGWGLELAGIPPSPNWVHFAVPVPKVIDNKPSRIAAVYVTFKGSRITSVHAWDGGRNIFRKDGLRLSGDHRDVNDPVARHALPRPEILLAGIVVSVGIEFGPVFGLPGEDVPGALTLTAVGTSVEIA